MALIFISQPGSRTQILDKGGKKPSLRDAATHDKTNQAPKIALYFKHTAYEKHKSRPPGTLPLSQK